MNSEELDGLILSTASPRWQKVSMIIAMVARDESYSAGDTEDELKLIADRISHLVAQGQLAAQGNLSNWRHSEICLIT